MSVIVPHGVDPAVFDDLSRIVERVRDFGRSQNRRSQIRAELEVRFGNLRETDWSQLLGSLELFKNWTEVGQWREIVDFFYDGGDLGTVRTSREVSDHALLVTHLRKERQENLIMSVKDCRLMDNARVTFSIEEEIDYGKLPESTETTRVRIKHRKTFRWNDWMFDITKSWSGVTYCEAMRKKEVNDSTSFEFEIELSDPNSFLEKSDHTNEFVTACIFLRILGVLPKSNAVSFGPYAKKVADY